jgi:hypothetical protein
VQIDGQVDLFRDEKTGAVINRNSSGAKAARAAVKKYNEDQGRLNKLEDDVSEIKNMIKQLLEK